MNENLHEYIAVYERQHLGVYAPSLLRAKEIALQHFKPPKKKEHMVGVVLVAVADKPVTSHVL